MSIQYGTRVRFIKMLLSRGFNINKIEYNGYKDECTLLHYAIKRNELESVILLLNKGADFNIQNLYGQTALENAAIQNHREIFFEIMYRNNKDIDYIISQLYFFAKTNNSAEIIHFFLINSENVDSDAYRVWCFANEKEDKELLKKIFSPDDIIELCCFSIKNCMPENLSDLLNLLIMKIGDDLSQYQFYEKLFTIDLLNKYNKKIVDLLESRNILYHAISTKNEKLVQILVDNGADINQERNNYSFSKSLIFDAIYYNNEKIVQILLDKGADINSEYTYMSSCTKIIRTFTPETYAIYRGNDKIIALLNKIEFNKDIEIFNNTCPISLKKYKEIEKPVVSKYGHVYEYECIKKWLYDNDKCPVTRNPLGWFRTDIFLLEKE